MKSQSLCNQQQASLEDESCFLSNKHVLVILVCLNGKSFDGHLAYIAYIAHKHTHSHTHTYFHISQLRSVFVLLMGKKIVHYPFVEMCHECVPQVIIIIMIIILFLFFCSRC